MKKDKIIKILHKELDNREYEFWFNPKTHEFGGNYFFATEQREKEYEIFENIKWCMMK